MRFEASSSGATKMITVRGSRNQLLKSYKSHTKPLAMQDKFKAHVYNLALEFRGDFSSFYLYKVNLKIETCPYVI